MHTFTVLYYRVDDETALEGFFSGTHLPLLEALPGLRAVEIGRVQGQPLGQSRFALIVAATFDSRTALEAALATQPGIFLMNALKQWAENRLLTWYYTDTFREERGS